MFLFYFLKNLSIKIRRLILLKNIETESPGNNSGGAGSGFPGVPPARPRKTDGGRPPGPPPAISRPPAGGEGGRCDSDRDHRKRAGGERPLRNKRFSKFFTEAEKRSNSDFEVLMKLQTLFR